MSNLYRCKMWFRKLTDEQKAQLEKSWRVVYEECCVGNFKDVAGIIENILMDEYPVVSSEYDKKPQLPDERSIAWQETILSLINGNTVQYTGYYAANVAARVYDYFVALYSPQHLPKPSSEYVYSSCCRSFQKDILDTFYSIKALLEISPYDTKAFVTLLRKCYEIDKGFSTLKYLAVEYPEVRWSEVVEYFNLVVKLHDKNGEYINV